MTSQSLIEAIKAITMKEVELCTTQEQLHETKKRWDKYFNGMNKFLAGKGRMPYFDEQGKVCYEA